MKRTLCGCAALLLVLGGGAFADPVPEIDYQGKVLVNDLPYHGTGYFKFALADASGSLNYWANDSTPAGEPGDYVSLSVINGVFSVVLGARPPMTNTIPISIFAAGTGLYLRVWFSSTTNGFVELLPAQRIVSTPYALHAHLLDGYHAAELIAAATNGVALVGDVIGPPQNNQIAANAVTTLEILADTITAGDIAVGGVASAEIADGSVTSADIQDGTITAADIMDNSVTTFDVAADTLTASDIAVGAVFGAEIADGTIMDVDIGASAAIAGSKLQAGTTTNRGALQLATGSTGAQAIATGHPFLNAYGRVNTLAAGAPGSPLNVVGAGAVYVSNLPPATLLIGAALAGGSVALSNLDHVVWVATNGTAAGPGTIERPYDTPQNGYNAAAARYSGVPCAVLLAAGVYPGGLTMSAGNVHVLGLDRPVLDNLNVTAAAVAPLLGKQRVENVVIKNGAFVAAAGAGVKFHNCRMLGGLQINGNQVEVQHCHITQTELASAALVVGDGNNLTQDVGIHHASILYTQPGGAAVLVAQKVSNFELLWSEVVCSGGGPAILDNESSGPLSPVHLYAHNWIKGPSPEGGLLAVSDPLVGQTGRTIGFYNNTVFGHVGVGGHFQYYGNNMVYGRINFVAPGPNGWQQAGAGTGADAANNTEHELGYPTLPNVYRD